MRSVDESGRAVAEDHWPAGGTALVAGVQPLGFAPVTKEILAEVVRRIVSILCPGKVVLFWVLCLWHKHGHDFLDAGGEFRRLI
jgi:hypothetical protein